MRKKTIAILGNCYAVRINAALTRLRKTADGRYDDLFNFCYYFLETWYLRPENFGYTYRFDEKAQAYIFMHPTEVPSSVPPHNYNLFSWYVNVKAKTFPYSEPALLPAIKDLDKDWIYCFGGLMLPVFPPYTRTKQHYDLIRAIEKGEIRPSTNFVADHYLYQHKPVLDFLLMLQNHGLNVLLIEPNRAFPPLDVPTGLYTKVIGMERAVVRQVTRQYNIPYFTLPEELVDENGFSPVQHRAEDFAHGDDAFHDLVAIQLLNYIEQNFQYKSDSDRLRYLQAG